jgi:hypothetical protein
MSTAVVAGTTAEPAAATEPAGAAEGSGGNAEQHHQQQAQQQQQQAPGLGAQGRKVSTQDIQLVQNLIERCLQMYMSRREVRRACPPPAAMLRPCVAGMHAPCEACWTHSTAAPCQGQSLP